MFVLQLQHWRAIGVAVWFMDHIPGESGGCCNSIWYWRGLGEVLLERLETLKGVVLAYKMVWFGKQLHIPLVFAQAAPPGDKPWQMPMKIPECMWEMLPLIWMRQVYEESLAGTTSRSQWDALSWGKGHGHLANCAACSCTMLQQQMQELLLLASMATAWRAHKLLGSAVRQQLLLGPLDAETTLELKLF